MEKHSDFKMNTLAFETIMLERERTKSRITKKCLEYCSFALSVDKSHTEHQLDSIGRLAVIEVDKLYPTVTVNAAG